MGLIRLMLAASAHRMTLTIERHEKLTLLMMMILRKTLTCLLELSSFVRRLNTRILFFGESLRMCALGSMIPVTLISFDEDVWFDNLPDNKDERTNL